jgi:Ca-activated chloride channel family protein
MSRPRRTAVGGALAMALALVTAAASRGQEQRPALPTFGAGVELVRLDVSVLSGSRFVTDLQERDLEIYEDGQRQVPSSFSRRELPVSLALLLDASSSIADRLPLAQAAAVGFLETLGPRDEASVIEFNDRVRVLQPYTSDREALRRAVGLVSAGGSTGLHNALYTTLKTLPDETRDAELRRRAIVLLSDGEDTASLVWEEQVVELARRREAAIHAIDLRPRQDADRSARLLRVLSRESGGEVHHPGSIRDLDEVYSRIAEELKSQYAVGYVSSNPAQDGRWRRIEVRVRGRGDLRVRHRTGYYAVP